MKKLITLATFAAFASPLWAATQTVTLSVPGMNCATCPITVKKALTKVIEELVPDQRVLIAGAVVRQDVFIDVVEELVEDVVEHQEVDALG